MVKITIFHHHLKEYVFFHCFQVSNKQIQVDGQFVEAMPENVGQLVVFVDTHENFPPIPNPKC